MASLASTASDCAASSSTEGPSSPNSSAEVPPTILIALDGRNSYLILSPHFKDITVMLIFLKGPRKVAGNLRNEAACKIPSEEESGVAASFTNRRTDHKNVVQIVGICRELGAVVIEKCEPLREFLERRRSITFGLAVEMALGCVDGLIHLHDRLGGIWDRNGASLDFYVAGNTLKVADDQLSRSSYFINPQAKINYMAPEVLASIHCDAEEIGFSGNIEAVDVYSFGIVMWSLLCFEEAWRGETFDQIRTAVMNGERPAIPRSILRSAQQDRTTQSFLTLMKNCWHQNENERPTLVDVRQDLLNFLTLLEEDAERGTEQGSAVDGAHRRRGNLDLGAIPEEESVIHHEGPQRGIPPIVATGVVYQQKSRLMTVLMKLWRTVYIYSVKLFCGARFSDESEGPQPLEYDAVGIQAPTLADAVGVPFNPAQFPLQESPFSIPPPLPPLDPLGKKEKDLTGTIMVVDWVPKQATWGKIRGYSLNCLLNDQHRHVKWNNILVATIATETVPARKVYTYVVDAFFNTPEIRGNTHWDTMMPWLVKPMIPKVVGDSITWVDPENQSSDSEDGHDMDAEGSQTLVPRTLSSSRNNYFEEMLRTIAPPMNAHGNYHEDIFGRNGPALMDSQSSYQGDMLRTICPPLEEDLRMEDHLDW